MARLVCLFLAVVLILPARGQKAKSLERKLNIFWTSKNLRAKKLADAIDFHPGDTIADIGTADGWFAAALSTYGDSLTVYLEDIDTSPWSPQAFDSAFRYFCAQNGRIPSHQFHYVKGTETSTGLPFNTFHKILIVDTYHHFNNRDAMLDDAKALLKHGGKIVILEAVARRPGDFHHGCKKGIFSEEEIISQLTLKGMVLQQVTFIHKVAGRKNKLFIFTKT